MLATLGIMVGLFTVTGFINRMGGILLRVGEFHIIAMVLMAWVFGWLVGAGLPPTATYIVLAVITVDPMRKLGIDPWVAHFFAFCSQSGASCRRRPPLRRAVSARIAEASFVRTMYQALKLCLPITLMTFAIFTRFNLVVNPGWLQIGDMLLVAVACWGITYSIFGKFLPEPGLEHPAARGAGARLVRDHVPPEQHCVSRAIRSCRAGDALRRHAPSENRPSEGRVATRGLTDGMFLSQRWGGISLPADMGSSKLIVGIIHLLGDAALASRPANRTTR